VTLNMAAASAASTCAILARNSPGRAFAFAPGGEPAGTAVGFGALEEGCCGLAPGGDTEDTAVFAITNPFTD
jgi:hypothetical protein